MKQILGAKRKRKRRKKEQEIRMNIERKLR